MLNDGGRSLANYGITAITASLRLTVNNRFLLVNEWKTLRIITPQRDSHILDFMDFKCWVTASLGAGDGTCASSARACVLPRSPRSKLCMAL